MQNRIRELRVSLGLTQYELAKNIGLNQSAVGKYERNELEPSVGTLIKLSHIFECSIDYILGNSDDLGVISIKNEKSPPAMTAEEQHLLETFRALNMKNKLHVSTYADIRLEEQEDYKTTDFLPRQNKNKKI